MARAIGEAHRRYTCRINFRENWRGHLWQERFASFPIDEPYLLAAARYVEMNPVEKPADYCWSSARAHLTGQDDDLIKVAPFLDLVPDWHGVLQLTQPEEVDLFHRHERTGRPLAGDGFVANLERLMQRTLSPQKPGSKKKKS
ncbi:hypothetical protein [uncultured Desulfuromusa sp.]|uniref:hypothetical protein n=1 Tax=uncultured Desulfuromusa sp. TaxID=219183 RepID=UPI002AA87B2D|nr:hypothetical protein [uncultured Desulfuromusa sp.]